MKIKYKKKLVKRAEHNAKEDMEFVGHAFLIKGSEELNKPFLGCAVGCLILPSNKQERIEFFKDKNHLSYHSRLKNEFGIPVWLSTAAENLFVELEGELIEEDVSPKERTRRLGNFVISFAKALPEDYKFEDDIADGDERDSLPEDRKRFLEWLRRRDKKRVRQPA